MSKFNIVETEYGKVRGVVKVTALNSEFISFLGIPYAAPPLETLRFKVKHFRYF